MTSIISRTSMTDAFLELYRSFFDKDKNIHLSEIQDPLEGEAIAKFRIKAKFYGDQYAQQYLDERVQQMLTLNRQNATILKDLVTKQKEDIQTEDKNIGVKKDLDRLLEGINSG